MLLFLSSWRHLLRHPWQFGLSVLGVALGVAVVLSVDLTNASAIRSFELSVESVSGRATHQIQSADGEVPEHLYVSLRRDHQLRQTAPIVEGYVGLPRQAGQAFQLLGVDPFAEAPFRPYLAGIGTDGTLAKLLTQPNALILSAGTAEQLGVKLGDRLEVRVGSQTHELEVIGLLTPDNEFNRQALKNLLLTDLSVAQTVLGLEGRLSRIDVLIEGENSALLQRFEDALPPGVRLEPVSSRVDAGAKMTEAFRLNLQALSLLALVVGMFLIYNTMTFSVVQRYPLLGRLRAVGITRREVFGMVLGEALVVGVLGTALGLAGGIALAQELVRLVTQTINDLYFVLNVNEVNLAAESLLKGLGLGLGATLLAVLPPALEASGIAPKTVLTRSVTESSHRRLQVGAALLGSLLVVVGGILLRLETSSLPVSYTGLFSVLVGVALLTPLLTVVLMRLLSPLASRGLGLLGTMSVRGVQAELSRTGVAIAALMIAVAAAIGLQVMVGSFRTTVHQWLGSQLWADIYVSPPALVSNRSESFLDEQVLQVLSETPGVRYTTRYRGTNVESDQGELRVIALNLPEEGYASYRFKEELGETAWTDFETTPRVVISEPLAYREQLQAGDRLTLTTPQGPVEFLISGVFLDYASERGFALMSRRQFEQYWQDLRSNSMALHLEPGQSVEAVLNLMTDRLAKAGKSSAEESSVSQDVIIRSNATLREQSLAIFDRTFAITGVLQLLVAGVAFVGVLSALMALQLERQRELGVLRATGMTPRQLWALVTGQCSLMGLVAGLLAMPVGVMLASVLIHVINRRSFGWTFPTVVSEQTLLEGVLLAVIAAVLAGLYPAWRMAQTPAALALREE